MRDDLLVVVGLVVLAVFAMVGRVCDTIDSGNQKQPVIVKCIDTTATITESYYEDLGTVTVITVEEVR